MATLTIRAEYIGEYREMQIDHDCTALTPDGATGTLAEMIALREWVCGQIERAECDLHPADVGTISLPSGASAQDWDDLRTADGCPSC